MADNSRFDVENRVIRLFVSSTFLDFRLERDLLMRRVFPDLRRIARDRSVEFVDIDLRWGIPPEQAERGETLSVCLAEIDRCRPYFLGLLGERYGWIPPAETRRDLSTNYGWLESEHGVSVTELEILHGVLNKPEMQDHALFYFRDPAWAQNRVALGDSSFASEHPDAAVKMSKLKERIRGAGCAILENYRDPEALAQAVHADLLRVLDQRFPINDIPDEAMIEARRHASYARDRQRLYLRNDLCFEELDRWIEDASPPPMLVMGCSGGGKSALLANWSTWHRARYPSDIVFEHYLGASAESRDSSALVRRIIGEIARRVPGDFGGEAPPSGEVEALASHLSVAQAAAEREHVRWVLVLDGLDELSDQADLRWLPSALPDHIRLLASCTRESVEGAGSAMGAPTRSEARAQGRDSDEVFSDLRGNSLAIDSWRRRRWREITIDPLTAAERGEFTVQTLARHVKTLPPLQVEKIAAHPLAGIPLFLKVLVEELRLFGVYAELNDRLDRLLSSHTVNELFDKLLERVETDCGRELVRRSMSAIWASRAGLEESELLEIIEVPPAAWSALRIELGEALSSSLGRINFGHRALRQAIATRYLGGDGAACDAHLMIADVFERRGPDRRQAEELPWQLLRARALDRLEALLIDLDRFALLSSMGDQELLGYWLPLKELGRGPEQGLCTAWLDRFPGGRSLDRDYLALGRRLQEFFEFAGAVDATSLTFSELLVAAHQQLLGRSDQATLFAVRNYSKALQARGLFVKAEQFDRELLEAQERLIGAQHADTLDTMMRLATAATWRREFKAAESQMRRVVAIAEQTLGADDALTLHAEEQLAEVLAKGGDLAGAETLRRQVLEVRERLLGREHPATLDAMENLIGNLIEQRGDLTQAKYVSRRVLEARERILGLDHPKTLKALKNLARVLSQFMDSDARADLKYLLDQCTRVFGSEHPETLEAMQYLAKSTRHENTDACFGLLTHLLEVRERTLGVDHPATLDTLNNLADVLFEQNKLKEAESLQRRLLERYARCYGAASPASVKVAKKLDLIVKAQADGTILEARLAASRSFGESLGIVFNIDELLKIPIPYTAGTYGYAAYRILFDALPLELLKNTRWRDGDTAATLGSGIEDNYVIAIEAPNPGQLAAIRAVVEKLKIPSLPYGKWRFLEAAKVAAEPLCLAMRFNAKGVPNIAVGGGLFCLAAWNAARDSRGPALKV